jgi:methionyl-tRNA formyltransferase
MQSPAPSQPRFAFFGTPYVARDTLAALVTAGYVPSVVITSPDALRGRGLELTPCETKVWALEHNLPVLTPAKLDETFLAELARFELTYAVVVAYGKIIPQAVLDAFPNGILNVHYSLLPAYRSASPVEAALRNGETVTGVTVQEMAFQLDAGDILSQEQVAIAPDDTTLTLRPRLIEAGSALLIQTLPSFIEGTVQRVPQDEARATCAPKIRKEEGCLNLVSGDPLTNWHTYRALRESPGTYFFAEKDGVRIRIKITDASYENGTFTLRKIVPEGKREVDASWLAQAGWTPCAKRIASEVV